MKSFQPTSRLAELEIVLQYDTQFFKCELKEKRFLKWTERISINIERANIMKGNTCYKQDENLEIKIKAILVKIKNNNWKPINKIQYI